MTYCLLAGAACHGAQISYESWCVSFDECL